MTRKGKISDIFLSIQGEGPYMGARQIFVRFYGCNLKCRYCDTELTAYDKYTPRELYAIIKSFETQYHSISFTGGEPLLQAEFLRTVLGLVKHDGIRIYLETNGTLYRQLSSVIDLVDIVAMDIKLPSATGLAAAWEEHRKFIETAKDKELIVKTVITRSTSKDDLIFAVNLVKSFNNKIIFVLQPNTLEMGDKLVKKTRDFHHTALEVLDDARIIPQVHRFIGVK